MNSKLQVKEFSNKILTGMSIGIVVALVPSALLGELAKALDLVMISQVTAMASRLLAIIMGLCIALQFKFTPIQSGTLAITTMVGSGALKFVEGSLILGGIGDVINAGLTAALAVIVLQLIGDRLKAYTILLVPTTVITLVGSIGLVMLPTVAGITSYLGAMINSFTTLQPVLMGILIATTFAFLIVSPVSTVGVAMAIQLGGIGSGAANLGICAAGFGLAVAGFHKNGLGTSAAHFLGSPKMQMANFVSKPKMLVPILVNAMILGGLAGLLNIQGTPFSAGFGFSGLIGPLNYLAIAGYTGANVLIAIMMFAVMPLIFGIVTFKLFSKVIPLVEEDNYTIKFK